MKFLLLLLLASVGLNAQPFLLNPAFVATKAPEAAGGGGGTFTLVGTNATSNGGSGTTLGVSVAGVQAGDLAVVLAVNLLSQTMTVSDGTSTLTAGTLLSSSAVRAQIHYITASVASGTVTYTATYGGSATGRGVVVVVFRPSAACSFDVQGTQAGSASSTAIDTGDITTTGTSELVIGYSANENNNVSTLHTINAVTPDGTAQVAGNAISYRAVSATLTGDYKATLSGAARHTESMFSFKIP